MKKLTIVCLLLAMASCTTFDQGLRLIELRGILGPQLGKVYEALDLGLQDRAGEMDKTIKRYLDEIGGIFNRPGDWSFIHRYVHEFIGPRPAAEGAAARIRTGNRLPVDTQLMLQKLCEAAPADCYDAADLKVPAAGDLGATESQLYRLAVQHAEEVSTWLQARGANIRGPFAGLLQVANLASARVASNEQHRRAAYNSWLRQLSAALEKERNGVGVFCHLLDRFNPPTPYVCAPRARGIAAHLIAALVESDLLGDDWREVAE